MTNGKHVRFLFVDAEGEKHLQLLRPVFRGLRDSYDFITETLISISPIKILKESKGKDIVVIHHGNRMTEDRLINIIRTIKRRYPSVKVGAFYMGTREKIRREIDFQLYPMMLVQEIYQAIKEALGKGNSNTRGPPKRRSLLFFLVYYSR